MLALWPGSPYRGLHDITGGWGIIAHVRISRRSRALALPLAVFVALAGAGVSAATAATAPQSTAAASATTDEIVQTILDDTNAVRAKKGLPALIRSAPMESVAMAWSRKQGDAKKMSHNPDYSTQIPSGWRIAAENVAAGYDYTDVVDAWEHSEGHYANIVSGVTHIGIGYYQSNGRTYFTQDFAKYPASTKFLSTTPKPKLAGTAKVHAKLRVVTGVWAPSGTKLSYRWYASGHKISGATKSTLKISSKYKGKRISVRVTGKKSGYASVTKASTSTAKVRKK